MQYNLHLRSLKFIMLIVAIATIGTARAQWAPVGTPGISPGGLSNWQHLIIDANNTPYVSFNDEGLPAGEGTLMKYDGSNWVSIGTPGFTAGIAHHSSFAIGPNGTYYFAYADGNNVSRGAAMMYNGTSWVSIGSSLSVGESQYTSLKIINDTVYLAFVDMGNGTVNVLKYNGIGWVPVGSSNGMIATGSFSYTSLSTDNFDTLYVAYQDNSNGGKATIQKFDGTSWSIVGAPFLSLAQGGAYDISVAFNHSNVPYVAYWNPYPAGPAPSVEKFDGTNWVNVGAPSFTSTIVQFTSIAIGVNDTPFVAFNEATTGSKAALMKFDGTNWVYVGTEGFSGSTAAYTALALDGNGNPYVAYYDEANSGKTTVMEYTTCNAPSVPIVTASDTTLCMGDTTTLSATGTLNDASKWYWYTGSCGGTPVDSGSSIQATAHDTVTYYARGFGNCVTSGSCSPITIDVDSVAKPTITVNGTVLTSSSANGYEWYRNNTLISGATSQSYTAAQSGWYTVTTTDGHCSSTSDSTHILINSGVATIALENSISIYPMPFASIINMDINSDIRNTSEWTVTITDNLGRTVYNQGNLKNINAFDLHQLSAGMYYMSVATLTGKQVYKIVKQ